MSTFVCVCFILKLFDCQTCFLVLNLEQNLNDLINSNRVEYKLNIVKSMAIIISSQEEKVIRIR